MNAEILEKKWTDIAAAQLEGKKIVQVRYLTTQERDELGWNYRCIVLQLNDGNLIFPSADDEGNDAGALFTNSETQPTIPVLR